MLLLLFCALSCTLKQERTAVGYESGLDPFNRIYMADPDTCLEGFIVAVKELNGQIYTIDRERREVVTSRINLTPKGRAGMKVPNPKYSATVARNENAIQVALEVRVVDMDEEGCKIRVDRMQVYEGQSPVYKTLSKRFEDRVLGNFHNIIKSYVEGDFSYDFYTKDGRKKRPAKHRPTHFEN